MKSMELTFCKCTVVPTVTNKKSPSFQHLIFDEVIDKWTKAGMLILEDGRLHCTEQGISVSNSIIVDFL